MQTEVLTKAVRAVRKWARPALKSWEAQHENPVQFIERFLTFVQERAADGTHQCIEAVIDIWNDVSRSDASRVSKKGVCVQFDGETGAPLILTGAANVQQFLGLTSAFKMGEMFASLWSLNGCISYHAPGQGTFIGTLGGQKIISLVITAIRADRKESSWALQITDLKYIDFAGFDNYLHLFPPALITAYFDTNFAGKKLSTNPSAGRVSLTHDPNMGIFAYVPTRGILMYCDEKFHGCKVIIVPDVISIRAAACLHDILLTGETSLAGIEGGSSLNVGEIGQIITTLEFLGVSLA